MKKTTALTLISAIFMALFVTFCAKPELIDNPNPADNTNITNRTSLDDYAMTTNDITVENGLLCFKDTASFWHASRSLESLSNDTGYVNTYLRSIGIAPGVPIEGGDYPADPIYQKFNARFAGFYSLRQHIYNFERTLLDNGAELEDLPVQLIGDDFKRSALNQYQEVKIGNLIYKEVGKYHNFVITNNDISLLPILRANTDFYDVGPFANLALVDYRVLEDSIRLNAIYSMSMGVGCQYKINYQKIGPNTYEFTNETLYFGGNGNNANLYWEILDANGVTIGQSSNSQTFIFEVQNPLSVAYPLSVKMTHTSPCIGTFREVFANQSDCLTSLSLQAVEKELQKLSIDFTLDVGPISNYDIIWNFGDGTSPVTTHNTNKINHTFPDLSGTRWYTVCATVNHLNCTKSICRTYDFGCGFKPSNYKKVRKIDGTDYSMVNEFIFDHKAKGDRSYKFKMTCKKGKNNSPAKSMSIDKGANFDVLRTLHNCQLRTDDGLLTSMPGVSVFSSERTVVKEVTNVRPHYFKADFILRIDIGGQTKELPQFEEIIN